MGNTPYGPGDQLPLVDQIRPEIADNTTGIPTTGDEFVFEAKAWDDLLLRNANVQYWYDSGPGNNLSMNMSAGNYQNATYTQTINISSNATKMYYNLSVTDTGSNWVNTPIKSLAVIDNDPPDIRDVTFSTPKTGDDFEIISIINDNIGISNSYLEYWFDDENKFNETFEYNINTYKKTIRNPIWATNVSYKISAKDTSDNWANLQTKIINVTDDERPTIIDNSGTPTTGDGYNFVFNSSDNIEIVSKNLEYWIDDNSHENISIKDKNSYNITIPENAYLLNYLITVIDSSNNLYQISESKPVIDNDQPIIIENTSGKPETNKTFTIEFSIIENRDIGNITLNYWYDEQNKINQSFLINNYGSYNHSIQIPIDKRDLNYEIIVSDLSNNTARLENMISIIDTIPPVITDLTNGTPTTGDEFNISVNVTENIELEMLSTEYWFDDKPIPKTSNQVINIILVPQTSKILFYNVTARDRAGNEHIITNELIVIDNDQPEIVIQNNTPTTGDMFEMEINVRDNINISISYLLFSTKNNMNYSNISLEPGINTYTIILPNNSKTLRYNIIAIDESNNTFSINKTVNVIDNDSPIVDDYSPESGTTGDLYVLNLKLTDNILLSEIEIIYGPNIESNVTQIDAKESFYFFKISVGENVTILDYSIIVTDLNNNSRILERSIPIYDNDRPIIFDFSSQLNDKFEFKIELVDNIGVQEATVFYRFDNGSLYSIDLSKNDDYYTTQIIIPDSSVNLYYKINVTDLSNNSNSIPEKVVELEIFEDDIIDNSDNPDNNDLLWLYLLLILIIILIILFGYIYYKKRENKSDSITEDEDDKMNEE